MAENNFKPFAIASGANVVTQAEWEALIALATGFTAGIARAGQINKALRQATVMGSVLAQFMADNTGKDILDDGNISDLVQKLHDAVNSIIPSIPVTSVNNKTGAVVLAAGDVGAYPSTGGTLSGPLSATGQISEAGQRVYSPNNPPPQSFITSGIANIETGAVGSYAMLRNTTLSSTINPGDVVSGSRLAYSGVTAYGGDSGGDWARITEGSTVSGSWRCMGLAINTDRHYGVSLFLRIA
ncbi:MAG: hypothetical protein P0Y63_04375 [Klebsiella huaxiensis]|uniref:hypothetical protein n=1 Tax=Klebsiella huaxiensis TaxID=2153354 RepID=UPI0026EC61BE|nr:hypothetical protein [Klebsiella huaxiensis]WEJ90258.1 MAG: hypothetical protein P0Y63_04375 [Klebsiella huaxiensis]